MEQTRCDFCSAALESSREFIYQYESLKFCDNEDFLNLIRRMPGYRGEPLRVCKKCSESIEANIREREEKEIAIRRQQQLNGTIILIGLVLIVLAMIVTAIIDSH